ncbi:universal stress protein [Pseudomonadota bacterium]
MFKKILVAIDLLELVFARRAIKAAVALAKQNNAALKVMTVLPGYSMPLVAGFFPKDYESKAKEAAASQLDAFVAKHVPDALKVSSAVLEGHAYEQVLKMADKWKANLIVMGAHSPELKDYLLGPNAARVVRHAKQSVLVVRG